MPDVALYDVQNARPAQPSKYNALCTLKWIGGLQTQRSPFASVDTRYNSRYLGGKPDALIAGSNIELSNRLTLQRRPGLLQYGTVSIPSADFFYSWQQPQGASFQSIVDPNFITYPQGNLQLIVDTATNGTTAPGSIYNYSPTYAGIILNKAVLSQQTNFQTVVNTMYMGDGVDLYKDVGVNLLTWSNTFGTSPWSSLGATLTTGQTDPTGGTAATQVVFSTTGSSATSYLLQHVSQVALGGVPYSQLNYTPASANTFTFSVWMKSSNAGDTIFLGINDSTGAVLVNTQQTLTTSWALYQVTATTSGGATGLTVLINDPSSSVHHYFIYGAQLEVGGPATPTTITRNKPNGVYLWGIQAPATAPTFTSTSQSGSTGVPWQPNHAYSTVHASVTTVAASSGGNAVYTVTLPGGSGNGLVGRYVSISGDSSSTSVTANDSQPPGFIVQASDATHITLNNPSAVADSPAAMTARLLDTIVDSNGNLEVAYINGTSGGSQPVWATVQGNPTSDGLQNVLVQNNSTFFAASSGSVAFISNVTALNTKLIFVATQNPGTLALTDSSGDTPTLLTTQTTHNFKIYMYYVLSATAGATTISFTGGGANTWLAIAEIEPQSAVDVHGSNGAQNTSSALFLSGTVTTTNAPDILVTFAVFGGNINGSEIGVIPFGFQTIASLAQTAVAGGFWNASCGFEALLTEPVSVSPQWTITNPGTPFNNLLGITAALKSTVGTLVWYNAGQTAATGLTPKTGYQYMYSFVNIYTGHRSNASPLSATTGPQTGVSFTVTGVGCQITTSGTGASLGTGDPQVDAIEVYRNTDGGGFWYQIPALLMTSPSPGLIQDANGLSYLANPGTTTSQGTWSFIDTVPDTSLNTQIFAPIAFLNSTPPTGLKNMEFFDGRLWGSVGNILYYATAADDATLINVLQNGVSAESWEPTNYIPFNSQIVRSVTTGVGLLVFTTTDVWLLSGTNLATYNPIKVMTGVGLGSYNGVVIDGSTLMLYTRDRQCLMFNVNAGLMEIGFLIGDLIETNINPLLCYLARHVKGSQDNAFYFADGSTGWFRLNPNQTGASASGEQTPIWSPFATIASAGGCGAIASIEVQPGVKQLLVSSTGTGTSPILNRDINTFTDNGSKYTWSATIGSLMLALPGKLSEIESIVTEMNNLFSLTQCGVAVTIDEIGGVFESITNIGNNPVNDPPQLTASVSVLSNRFYLSPGTEPPVGRHMQIMLTGAAAATRDELLALTVIGAPINEQQ